MKTFIFLGLLLFLSDGCSTFSADVKPDEPIIVTRPFPLFEAEFQNSQGRKIGRWAVERDLDSTDNPKVKEAAANYHSFETAARIGGGTRLAGLLALLVATLSTGEDNRARWNLIGYPLVAVGWGISLLEDYKLSKAVEIRNQEIGGQKNKAASYVPGFHATFSF